MKKKLKMEYSTPSELCCPCLHALSLGCKEYSLQKCIATQEKHTFPPRESAQRSGIAHTQPTFASPASLTKECMQRIAMAALAQPTQISKMRSRL